MAIIYKATLNPSKLNLLNAWMPSRPWFTGVADAQRVGAYRFDDPAGEVGLEAAAQTVTGSWSGGGPAVLAGVRPI
jgi:hypothetical protein